MKEGSDGRERHGCEGREGLEMKKGGEEGHMEGRKKKRREE